MIVMKWARLDGNRVIETTDIDPAGRFHPSLMWESVPVDATPNSTFEAGVWSIVNWNENDAQRLATLQANIAGLQGDASAADRIAGYERELIEVQARLEQARLDAEAAFASGEGSDTAPNA